MIKIRKAEEKDFPAVLELVHELAAFVNHSDLVTNTVEQMKKEKEHFSVLVAEKKDGSLIAMAAWFYAYSTWEGKTLYLDDLYVKEEYRGSKTGSKLLNRLFQIARETNCSRVRWQVLDWNEPAVNFYKSCGADIDFEVGNCDFNRSKIEHFSLPE